jgi:hypothetical protein
MSTIQQNLSAVKKHDRRFAGTIAFRNEKLTLPDGSKVAIGIDSERWVVLYQKTPATPFVIYEYNADTHLLFVDKKQGGDEDYRLLSKIVNYFFSHADVSDVVTIEVKRKG